MKIYDDKVIVAIESIVENQVRASGIFGELHRLDGEKIIDAIIDQLEGFVLAPKEPTEEMLEAGYQDSFDAKGFEIKIIYKAMLNAFEQGK